MWNSFMSIDADKRIDIGYVLGSPVYRAVFKNDVLNVFTDLNVCILWLKGYKDNVIYVNFQEKKKVEFNAAS